MYRSSVHIHTHFEVEGSDRGSVDSVCACCSCFNPACHRQHEMGVGGIERDRETERERERQGDRKRKRERERESRGGGKINIMLNMNWALKCSKINSMVR